MRKMSDGQPPAPRFRNAAKCDEHAALIEARNEMANMKALIKHATGHAWEEWRQPGFFAQWDVRKLEAIAKKSAVGVR